MAASLPNRERLRICPWQTPHPPVPMRGVLSARPTAALSGRFPGVLWANLLTGQPRRSPKIALRRLFLSRPDDLADLVRNSKAVLCLSQIRPWSDVGGASSPRRKHSHSPPAPAALTTGRSESPPRFSKGRISFGRLQLALPSLAASSPSGVSRHAYQRARADRLVAGRQRGPATLGNRRAYSGQEPRRHAFIHHPFTQDLPRLNVHN